MCGESGRRCDKGSRNQQFSEDFLKSSYIAKFTVRSDMKFFIRELVTVVGRVFVKISPFNHTGSCTNFWYFRFSETTSISMTSIESARTTDMSCPSTVASGSMVRRPNLFPNPLVLHLAQRVPQLHRQCKRVLDWHCRQKQLSSRYRSSRACICLKDANILAVC